MISVKFAQKMVLRTVTIRTTRLYGKRTSWNCNSIGTRVIKGLKVGRGLKHCDLVNAIVYLAGAMTQKENVYEARRSKCAGIVGMFPLTLNHRR